MNVARSVAEVLTDHVVFEVECIDRMYCNVYQPRLQHVGGVVGYVQQHLGLPIASTAPLAAISDRFVAGSMVREGHPRALGRLRQGPTQRRRDARAAEAVRRVGPDRGSGVHRPGAGEDPLFRTEKRRNADRQAYPWIVKTTGMVNHFYFYCLDADFGPFFIKFCSYFPYNAKLCLNGHHWAQRQAAKAGIGFTAMDNAFAAVDDVARLQAICDSLGPTQIHALLDKWLARLPHPFTADDRADGFDYDISILQAEFSLTQMLDAPVTGRIFFEHVIRDNLDVGRADQVGLIFDRRIHRGRQHRTQSRFRTRVITDGVTPSLHADYKHTTIKQYHKEGRALRTETTINDSRDFNIGKRLVNLPALREIGFSANRRLLRVQRLDHDPLTGTQQLHHVLDPVITDTGTTIPGLRLGQPRSHALLSALLTFRTQIAGFTNRDLRQLTGQLRGLDPETVTAGQATYDLRRLRTHGLIERVPHTHRYTVTDYGLHTAMLLIQSPRTTTSHRTRRPPRPHQPQPTPQGSPQLPTRPRRPRHPERSPDQTNLTESSGFAGLSPLRRVRDFARTRWPLRGSSGRWRLIVLRSADGRSQRSLCRAGDRQLRLCGSDRGQRVLRARTQPGRIPGVVATLA